MASATTIFNKFYKTCNNKLVIIKLVIIKLVIKTKLVIIFFSWVCNFFVGFIIFLWGFAIIFFTGCRICNNIF